MLRWFGDSKSNIGELFLATEYAALIDPRFHLF